LAKHLHAKAKTNEAQHETPMTRYETLSIIAYFLTFAATAIYAVFVLGQWCAIRRHAAFCRRLTASTRYFVAEENSDYEYED
jgi:hypothetical protein